MIVVCPSCHAKYKFDASKLGDRPKAKTKCSKCGGVIEIENPQFGAMTLPPDPDPQPRAAPAASHMVAPSPPPPPPPPEPDREELTQKSRSVGKETAEITSRTMKPDVKYEGLSELPRDRRYSLAVIQGAATGQIFQLTSPRTVLGRSASDIILDDAEASRQHAAVEILGENAILRDLGSTNGTFIEAERIHQEIIQNQGEFRIGSHVLMFIITSLE